MMRSSAISTWDMTVGTSPRRAGAKDREYHTLIRIERWQSRTGGAFEVGISTNNTWATARSRHYTVVNGVTAGLPAFLGPLIQNESVNIGLLIKEAR